MDNKRQLREEKAKQTTFEGCGLSSSAAEWKGMGPSGYHKPPSPSLVVTSCFGQFVLLLCLIFLSVEGFHQSNDCHVERCSNEYEKHRLDLDMTRQGPIDPNAICTILRTYRHCINKTVGCHGNILYYTIRNFVRQEMELGNCSANGQTVEDRNSSAKPHHRIVPVMCQYHGKKVYRHCGLFGDPHLRTFYGEYQTCRAKGAWPLVNNEHLTVQVTNDPVEGNMDATATTKLTVIIKGKADCTSNDFQTYQTYANTLPGTFEDGRVSVGPYDSLELVEVDPGRHVEIHIRYISTLVVIRQIGRHFTFNIRMPEELVNQSSLSQDLQLCVRGCPQSELINYQEYLATRKYMPSSQDVAGSQVDAEQRPVVTRSYAENICRDAKLSDFYFDSCVFDLMATGDQNFTLSAVNSLNDVLKLHPSVAQTMLNRSTLGIYDGYYGYSGGQCTIWTVRTQYQFVFIIMLTLLVSVLCSR